MANIFNLFKTTIVKLSYHREARNISIKLLVVVNGMISPKGELEIQCRCLRFSERIKKKKNRIRRKLESEFDFCDIFF